MLFHACDVWLAIFDLSCGVASRVLARQSLGIMRSILAQFARQRAFCGSLRFVPASISPDLLVFVVGNDSGGVSLFWPGSVIKVLKRSNCFRTEFR
jgi:hypothetical protein